MTTAENFLLKKLNSSGERKPPPIRIGINLNSSIIPIISLSRLEYVPSLLILVSTISPTPISLYFLIVSLKFSPVFLFPFYNVS